MAVDEFLLDRLRNSLEEKKISWYEKKMFGGVCFMVNEKMCFGTFQDGLMARVDPDSVEELLKKGGSEQMKMKDRIMKGYLLVKGEAYDSDEDLNFWIQKCLDWNPSANKSKKRRG